MKDSLLQDILTTFVATSLTLASIQIALPDKADSFPVDCNMPRCAAVIPSVAWERSTPAADTHQELEEMAMSQALCRTKRGGCADRVSTTRFPFNLDYVPCNNGLEVNSSYNCLQDRKISKPNNSNN